MAGTPRPPRRRPSSVQPGARPRRVAGRTAEAPPAVEPDEVEPDEVEPSRPEPAPDPGPATTRSRPAGPGLLASRRTTLVLAAVVVALALAGLGGGAYLGLRDDPAPRAAAAGSTAPNGEDLLTISPADARSVAQLAGQAAYDLVARSWQEYDAQVESATALLTSDFGEEFRATTDDAKPDFVRNKTEVQVSVVSQGVVSANDTEAQVLVFLNSLSTKNGEDTVYTPFRALVTMVRTDDGWLVADLETA